MKRDAAFWDAKAVLLLVRGGRTTGTHVAFVVHMNRQLNYSPAESSTSSAICKLVGVGNTNGNKSALSAACRRLLKELKEPV